jgi:hypothetical protein
MDRILAGTPEPSSGALTVIALALEAGVPRNALTQRHTNLKNEFCQRIRERGADNGDEARLRATVARPRKTIAGKNEDNRWQEQGTRRAPGRRPRTPARSPPAHPGKPATPRHAPTLAAASSRSPAGRRPGLTANGQAGDDVMPASPLDASDVIELAELLGGGPATEPKRTLSRFGEGQGRCPGWVAGVLNVRSSSVAARCDLGRGHGGAAPEVLGNRQEPAPVSAM